MNNPIPNPFPSVTAGCLRAACEHRDLAKRTAGEFRTAHIASMRCHALAWRVLTSRGKMPAAIEANEVARDAYRNYVGSLLDSASERLSVDFGGAS